MKKIILFALLVMILPTIYATSLSSAQSIAKEYVLSNETLDSEVYFLACDSNDFFVFSILDSKQNIAMFLPIEADNGIIIYEDLPATQRIIRSSLLYRNIKVKTTGSNYLDQPLIDFIDNLGISLESKIAKLDGIIKSNYSPNINAECEETKIELELLITKLQDLKTKLNKLQTEQNTFMSTTNCSQTDNLIYLFKTSFVGYNDLISLSINYRDATNEIVEVVVADQKLDEATKRIILNYTAAPTTLSTDVSTITSKLASTSQYYSGVISDFEKIGPNSPQEILQQTLRSRHDYYVAKNLLYGTVEKYGANNQLQGTLDEAINYILNSDNINLWKDTKTVSELNQNYVQIKDLYNKSRYAESISKIKLAKNQVAKINDGGMENFETPDISKYVIYGIIAIIVILVVLVIIKNIKHKKKKQQPKSKEIDPEYLLNKRDPFK